LAEKVENSSFVLLSRFSAIRQESALKTATSHIREPLAVRLKRNLYKIRKQQLIKNNTMSFEKFKIEKYSDKYRNQVLDVWEKSVLATHNFLKPSDFKEIKQLRQVQSKLRPHRLVIWQD
jgi:hypothetical protein